MCGTFSGGFEANFSTKKRCRWRMAMPRKIRALYLVAVVIYAALGVLSSSECVAGQPRPPTATEELSLKSFLQDYFGSRRKIAPYRPTRYAAAFVKLGEDNKEKAIVYMMGDDWCGSGGCSTYILDPQGASFRVISAMTIVHLPIRMLDSQTHGWHDLGVWEQGGGILPGYEALLPFNGTKYPGNPSMPPARRLHGKAKGTMVIPTTAEGTPLFD